MSAARRSVVPVLVAALAAAALLAVAPRPDGGAALVAADDVRVAVARLAVGFVPNRGQAASEIRYHTYASSPAAAFTPNEAVVQLAGHPSPLRLRFLGARPSVAIEARRQGAARVSYLLGNDPAKWVSGLPAYGELVYRGVWPGVDLAFRAMGGKLKYDVLVAPGADIERVRLSYPDAGRLSLDAAGNLRIHTPRGVLTEQAPRSRQVVGGRRVEVASRFVLHGRRAYGFALGPDYDRGRPLVIDPALHYSTFVGGISIDNAQAVAVDAAGNAYVTGSTTSSNFPRTIGPPFGGSSFTSDGFVLKLSPGGDSLVYATFFGGSSFETGKSIDVDGDGNAYVVGETGSGNFPTTPGAFDRTFGSFQDPFAFKLDPTGGSLVYSTYLGGPGSEGWVRGKRAPDGTVYVVGSTSATDIVPAGVPAFRRTRNGPTDGFFQRLNPAGSALVGASYLGGSLHDAALAVAVGTDGTAYFTGWTQSADFPTTEGAFDRSHNGSTFACCGFGDAYLLGLDASGTTLTYGTFLGGRGDDQGNTLALGPGGNVYVAGSAGSLTCCGPPRPWFSGFPTTPGAFDGTFDGISDPFVARIDPAATGGSQLVWSTFVGGRAADGPSDLVVDATGDAYAAGWTVSVDFPTTPGAVTRASAIDFSGFAAWTSWVTGDGTRLRWSSLLDGPRGIGNGDDQTNGLARDAAGTLYAAGRTASAGFPVTPWAYDPSFNGGSGFLGDVFVSKLATTPQAQLDVLAFEVGRALAAGTLTPGQAAGLRAALESAKREVDRGNAPPAADQLRTFIGHVNNVAREGPLRAEEALFFMDEATDVILFVDFWLTGAGAPGPGPATAGPLDQVATVDILVPQGVAVSTAETLELGSSGEKADGLEGGCTIGDEAGHTARTAEVTTAGVPERLVGVVVRGDVPDGARVANLTFVGHCTAAGRAFQVFRGNLES